MHTHVHTYTHTVSAGLSLLTGLATGLGVLVLSLHPSVLRSYINHATHQILNPGCLYCSRCHVHTPFLLLPQTDRQMDRLNDTRRDPSPQRAAAVSLIRHTHSPMQPLTHTLIPAHTLPQTHLLIWCFSTDIINVIILSSLFVCGIPCSSIF